MKFKSALIIFLLVAFCGGAETVEPVIETTTTTTINPNQDCTDWFWKTMDGVDSYQSALTQLNVTWVEYSNLRISDSEMSVNLLNYVALVSSAQFNQERLTPNPTNEVVHSQIIGIYENLYNGLIALNKFTNLKTEKLFNEGWDLVQKATNDMTVALSIMHSC